MYRCSFPHVPVTDRRCSHRDAMAAASCVDGAGSRVIMDQQKAHLPDIRPRNMCRRYHMYGICWRPIQAHCKQPASPPTTLPSSAGRSMQEQRIASRMRQVSRSPYAGNFPCLPRCSSAFVSYLAVQKSAILPLKTWWSAPNSV